MTTHGYEYELFQNGVVVASVIADDRTTALREIMHYARQYAEDGPCLVMAGRRIDHNEAKSIADQITLAAARAKISDVIIPQCDDDGDPHG